MEDRCAGIQIDWGGSPPKEFNFALCLGCTVCFADTLRIITYTFQCFAVYSISCPVRLCIPKRDRKWKTRAFLLTLREMGNHTKIQLITQGRFSTFIHLISSFTTTTGNLLTRMGTMAPFREQVFLLGGHTLLPILT
ncbi:hypothetical protein ANANG_G00172580 [Anguilla anguilla]|uniref:Uncharacterized protein n=1 Tax=Anguilla anguilla TaxID=7936 RepID=A0A9D3MAG8_ANGAN|nr:hypothetical protein ANANG_G00172580 [Anguilla anguilla]